VALQPSDGKIVIGGSFTHVNGTTRNYVARLNVKGSVDSSFDSGTGPDDRVHSLALQPDGKVLIGGSFSTYDGTTRNGIARVNAYNLAYHVYLPIAFR